MCIKGPVMEDETSVAEEGNVTGEGNDELGEEPNVGIECIT